jgi:hypothetical protein
MILNRIRIPEYSEKNLLYKVYDSIYFDNVNGNAVELFGTTFSDKTTEQANDVVLTDIVLMSRNSVAKGPILLNYYTKTSTKPLKVDESKISSSMVNNDNYGIVPDSSNYKTYSNISYNYQTLYISCGTDTILHIYDCTKNVYIGTFLFRKLNDPLHSLYESNIELSVGHYKLDEDVSNNTYVKEPLYDPKKQTSLYQLSKYVLFDTTCRYIIIRKKDKIDQIDVYDCTTGHTGKANRVFENVSKPGIVVDTPTSIIHTNFSSFKPIYISDLNGANLVLCVPIPSCEKTAVAVISMDPTSQGLIFPRNVKIFNKDCTPTTAVTTAPVPVPSTAPVPVPSTTPVTTPATATSSTGKKDASMNSPCNMYQNTNIPSLDSIISDYYSKYWNNNNPVLTVDGVKRYSNDFLLKTQMIPPICPACPANNNSSCSNCGGNGGSGMSDISRNFTQTQKNIIGKYEMFDTSRNFTQTQKNVIESIKYTDAVKTEPKAPVITLANPTMNIPVKNFSLLSRDGTMDNFSYLPSNELSSKSNTTREKNGGDNGRIFSSFPERSEGQTFIPVTSDFSKFGK